MPLAPTSPLLRPLQLAGEALHYRRGEAAARPNSRQISHRRRLQTFARPHLSIRAWTVVCRSARARRSTALPVPRRPTSARIQVTPRRRQRAARAESQPAAPPYGLGTDDRAAIQKSNSRWPSPWSPPQLAAVLSLPRRVAWLRRAACLVRPARVRLSAVRYQ